ncbi:UvrD-helicase domain-containing protein [Paenibacillus sp. MZ03-122A]|uniref:UvrD-helicase domain-containing protein n=1 Tax=Paenibacillus sp. MZ03-122A TaxID=2962033 RepID=UPI0020B70C83|nr:AAA family ATPase [Paenibacillus sp. MZ03-122A]
MKIVVAGAGAGKTTSMAHRVLARFNEMKDKKIIYVITYTNAAKDHIRKKIIEINGYIPKQVLIETSHAFLVREVVFPFHHLLYGQQFTKVSQMKLSEVPSFKVIKIKELAANKIIHAEKITETAKWIISKKSNDKKETKDKRKKILAIMLRYLDSIFIDESQDIDKHLAEILHTLDENSVNICMVGDPKQDLRGKDAFKKMITSYKEKQLVEFIDSNRRCPISHVMLANKFISVDEEQLPLTSEIGELSFLFENDIFLKSFFDENQWDLSFIYKKNKRFSTHLTDQKKYEDNLSYELKNLVTKANINPSDIDKTVYIFMKEIIKDLSNLSNNNIFAKIESKLDISLTRNDKGRLKESINLNRIPPKEEGIQVSSIDSIKGLEGNRCLFILTTDLAPYLFTEKNVSNKMTNYLYVALTRAMKELVILVTKEVEEKYNRGAIKTNFLKLNISSKEEGYH